MNKYLFVDTHNGHEMTYHPFLINKSISQEKANHIMRTDLPSSSRMGIGALTFFELLEKRGYCPLPWKCDCCGVEVVEFKGDTSKWELIEGIMGNY
jgi:hypothetical protein